MNRPQEPLNSSTLSEEDSKIVHLVASRVRGLKTETFKLLLAELQHAGSLLKDPAMAKGIPALRSLLSSSSVVESAREELRNWKKRGIEVLCLGDNLYPLDLSEIYDPPLLLFYKGDISRALNSGSFIGVVGSRNADKFGFDIAFEMSKKLCLRGALVVSGLAIGIDGASHKGALASKKESPTIAVLGSGLDTLYPRCHAKLAEEIVASSGVLLSQFEPEVPPYPPNFLNRNRVIAGLSKGVLIIQAGKKSGSLVTGRHALEAGRDVFVVPGAITDPRYEGSNNLIKQGAYLVTSVEDILEVIPELRRSSSDSTEGFAANTPLLVPLESKLVQALRAAGSMHYNEITQKFSGEDGLATALVEIELKGLIERLPGNYIALKPNLSCL